MNAKPKHAGGLPSKQDLARFINDSPRKVGKREIVRAFRIAPEYRAGLRGLLRELEEAGEVGRGRGKNFQSKGALPPVAVITITGLDEEGRLTAKPVTWQDETPPPEIFLLPERQRGPALGDGDRLLARLSKSADGYEGLMIRKLAEAPGRTIGVYSEIAGSGRLLPTDKKERFDYLVAPEHRNGARVGELVAAEIVPGRRLGLRAAKIVERLGSIGEARSVSLIAIHRNGIPNVFPMRALEEAAAAGPARLGRRKDLRHIPFVTIDGADARDFDDAVWAAPDEDPENPGGWRIAVAIADVAHYVRFGSALDSAARERGNSTYFPDRVVPMLPEKLSNELCSLQPKRNRPVLAVEMRLDRQGNKIGHHFERAMIRSAARLTYGQIQAAVDGAPDEVTGPLMATVVAPLFAAYACLNQATRAREPLDLELPEMRIELDDSGRVADVRVRERLQSHRLIEEFMVLANVAAAETLGPEKQACMYRVHPEPDPEKLHSLSDFLRGIGINFSFGDRLRPALFNRIIAKTQESENAEVINQSILRAQSRACYSPENSGHFGLALARYAHFTSPIRRYADLLVHRALIRGGKMGAGGLTDEEADAFDEIGEQISNTERRAMLAERECIDRYIAAFLSDRIDAEFDARISGVTGAGLFIRLLENHADGLVPISSLGDDYYRHDERRQCLTGDRNGVTFRLGDALRVRLVEANKLTGGMIFAVANMPAGKKGAGAKSRSAPKDKPRRHGKRRGRH